MPVALGNGMKPLKRRTPTIMNLAWGQRYFWDGRAASLEAQASGPIISLCEMAADMTNVLNRLMAQPAYRQLFTNAYPGEPITGASVQRALATFERTIVSGEAPFDRWVNGDERAISDGAQRGFAIFNGKGNCSLCHSGWRFTDDSFHDVGVSGDDLGRGALLRKLPSVQFAFKTPTLRNVARRGPYMHNGSETTLAAVIEMYDAGGRKKRPSLSGEIQPLHLTPTEKTDLLKFLESLNSDDASVTVPSLP